jgi:undecaprenyl-diphosphatase
MTIWQAIILAIIEGITEFLPISSTGHMVLAESIMGIKSDDFTQMFTVLLNFGAILSVLILYIKRFFRSIKFYFQLFVAFIPAAVLGLLLDEWIEQVLGSPITVAVNLVLGGIVLLFIDNNFKNANGTTEDIDYPKAFKIGIFQALSMFPGVSRSAATIIGGQIQGLSRKAAAEFSFFLAVPTMFAASAYKVFKFFKAGNSISQDQWPILAIGNLVALVVALLAIKFFIGYINKNGFKIFGYYRIILGVVFIAATLMGVKMTIN